MRLPLPSSPPDNLGYRLEGGFGQTVGFKTTFVLPD